jgi:hypothetical protein
MYPPPPYVLNLYVSTTVCIQSIYIRDRAEQHRQHPSLVPVG